MKVENFKLEPWISGKTSAELENIPSHKLYLNGQLISRNLPYIEPEDNFLQIDVCDECFYVGCASGGYVQIFTDGDLIIWKEPHCSSNSRETFRDDFTRAYGLKQGTIFWSKDLYQSFLNAFPDKFSSRELPPEMKLDAEQAQDLWRIYGSKRMQPESIDSFSIDKLQDNFLTIYSEHFTDDECRKLFTKAKRKWSMANGIKIIWIPETTKRVVAMFDFDGFGEWDFLHLIGDSQIYPIGDGYGIEFTY